MIDLERIVTVAARHASQGCGLWCRPDRSVCSLNQADRKLPGQGIQHHRGRAKTDCRGDLPAPVAKAEGYVHELLLGTTRPNRYPNWPN